MFVCVDLKGKSATRVAKYYFTLYLLFDIVALMGINQENS